MTPEQRKRVAEILTGKKWKVVPWRPVNPEHNRDMILLDEKAGWNQSTQWKPKFDGKDWQRSQALAVVEWIAKAIEGKFESYMQRSEYSNHLRRYIAENNIEALGKLVLVDLASEINSDQLDVEEG